MRNRQTERRGGRECEWEKRFISQHVQSVSRSEFPPPCRQLSSSCRCSICCLQQQQQQQQNCEHRSLHDRINDWQQPTGYNRLTLPASRHSTTTTERRITLSYAPSTVAIFLQPLCAFNVPIDGDPSEFLLVLARENLSYKDTGWCKNSMISLVVLSQTTTVTDRQTDRRRIVIACFTFHSLTR